MNFEKAIPLGLVVNELVSNSLQHAFRLEKTNKSLKIEIICHRTKPNQLLISVRDNGRGLDKDFNIQKTNSLGLQIGYGIIMKQLGGKLDIVNDHGTCFNLLIPC
jgi:two-component sensor histidine kinase